MIVAYDLDGVLAAGPAPAEKPWGRMTGLERIQRQAHLVQHYAAAARIFNPPEPDFYVITARKNTAPVAGTTMGWLERHFQNRVRGLFLLSDSRSIENVVRFKSEVLRQIGAQEFTEDNKKILAGLLKTGLDCRLFWFDGAAKQPL